MGLLYKEFYDSQEFIRNLEQMMESLDDVQANKHQLDQLDQLDQFTYKELQNEQD